MSSFEGYIKQSNEFGDSSVYIPLLDGLKNVAKLAALYQTAKVGYHFASSFENAIDAYSYRQDENLSDFLSEKSVDHLLSTAPAIAKIVLSYFIFEASVSVKIGVNRDLAGQNPPQDHYL